MSKGKEIADKFSADDSDGALSQAIDSAIKAEREECAKVVEDHAVIDQHLHVYDHSMVSARLIRQQ